MKLVHILASSHYEYGGLEFVAYSECRELLRRGHRVSMVLPTPSANPGPGLNSMVLVRLRTIPVIGLPLVTKTSVRTIRTGDVVHVHFSPSLFPLVNAVIARLVGTRIITSSLNSNQINTGDSLRSKILLGIAHLELRIMERISDAILVQNSEDLREVQRRLGGGSRKLVVKVPPGIDQRFFENRTDTPTSPSQDARNILLLGRFDPVKGHEIAVKALEVLIRTYGVKNCVLTLAGSKGPYASKVRALVNDLGLEQSVSFNQSVTEDQKIELYDKADVVIIPTTRRTEAFCLVLSESRSRLRPVVASRLGALGIRIVNGVNGLLVEPGDPYSLADSINRILSDRKLAAKMAKAEDANVRPIGQAVDELIMTYGLLRSKPFGTRECSKRD